MDSNSKQFRAMAASQESTSVFKLENMQNMLHRKRFSHKNVHLKVAAHCQKEI
jgi:hypothetical protein